MATIVVDSVALAYLDEGAGDPVVLLHGWGGQAASMTPLVVGLRDQYRVIAFDLPGFGGSGQPPVPWGTPEYADLVYRAVALLGVQRATYVGHSFGGRLAIWLAAHHPDAVQALVLIDAAGIKPPTTLRRQVRQRSYKLAKSVLRVPIFGAWGAKMSERLAMHFGSPDYRAATGVMRSSFVKTVNLDLSECMTAITAPTLLIWGEKDQATPIADGRTMERLINGSRLIAVAGAGHFSYLDSPVFVKAVIAAFLQGTRQNQTR